MSKKRRVPKTGSVWHLSSEEATLSQKPLYNGFACGTGLHGDTKYNRAREKRRWDAMHRANMKGASGPLPLSLLQSRLQTLSILVAGPISWSQGQFPHLITVFF